MILYHVILCLVEILLKSSPILDELVIYYNPQSCLIAEWQKEFSQELSTFTKADPTAKFC